MKFLRNIFDNAHEKLNKSEKTKKFFPLVDAFDTLMFTPNHTTKNGAHIRDAIDLKRTMMLVIIAMVPALLFGMYNVGYWHYAALGEEASFLDMFIHGLIRVLPLIVVSYGVGLGIEFIFAIRNGHSVAEGFLVSGMLIPLIMPVDVPLWMVAVATAFAVLIGKEVFGGTGMNVLNVALTARAFLFFSHPTSMSGDKTWISGIMEMKDKGTLVDSISGATRLGDLAAAKSKYAEAALKTGEEAKNLMAEGDAMVAYLDGKDAFMDSFLGFVPGSIGETSALAILIGAALLLKTGIASWKVMLSFFLGGLTIAGILNAVGGNPYFEFDPIHQLMLGGFMFGMVFMVTDPVTAAQTSTGKFVYGFLAGALGILIRMANPAYPEGVMLGILIANVCAPTIDHMVIRANVQKRLKRLKTA
ncbi:NADH:ubiquinone reductase (Na(+)-transporting) subunit B [Parvicella tangerina]|uniref:Na(+)-translocating NADH-quinone reductase subunit B n=1 Tax=Parvicella tangerina TaxID=2829795 RepID=A0A916JN51_9FLAO|nr:NADH:ubiquinone reductase (Na(+)-transporting) subunit B [Parvicella tangerina]CAG5084079.1 Na(+)-translocating NADH-quinone reductase subunit B [Parvicella tangerina]